MICQHATAHNPDCALTRLTELLASVEKEEKEAVKIPTADSWKSEYKEGAKTHLKNEPPWSAKALACESNREGNSEVFLVACHAQ